MDNHTLAAVIALSKKYAGEITSDISADIAQNVTDWLDEHVDPETGYVIDDTLTIQGAAADAKKTGDELTALKNDLNTIGDVYSVNQLISRDTKINEYGETLEKTVDPTATAYRVVKQYDQFSANPSDEFYVFAKVTSDHPGSNKYNVRAMQVTSNGDTGTYYYAMETDSTTGVIVGKLTDFGNSITGLKVQVVRKYIGSAVSSYTENFKIDYIAVIKSDVEYIGDKSNYFLRTFAHTVSSLWERGYYSSSGTPAGSISNYIRTKKETYIQVCKGSQIVLASGAYSLSYCVYTKPDDEHFVERISVNAGSYRTFADDCYIRVFMAYTDSTAFDLDTWVANLPPLWSGTIRQYSPMLLGNPTDTELSLTSDNPVENKVVTENLNYMLPSYILPANWETKVQTIQEAQGTKFIFAIQTDTHYAKDENIYYGANLKTLTNRVGFDFVANLGDVIDGYADQTKDNPENMRAAMTQIISRYVSGVSCPFLISMGNHDTNKMWADAYSGSPFTFAEVWGREFRPAYNTMPKAFWETGIMYYYIDFNDVRVIVLNTQDGSDGGFGIGATQLSWFTNTALDTDKWVLVLSHVPVINGWSVSSNYVSSYADIVTALQAFKTNNGKVIGCMSGHTHTQETQTVDGILYVTFRNGANIAEVAMIDIDNKTINTIPVGFTGVGNRSFSFT